MDDQRPDEVSSPSAPSPATPPAASSAVTPVTPASPATSEATPPPPPPAGALLDDVASDEPSKGRGIKVATVIGSSVLVLGGLYVGAQYLLADRVPGGTEVSGIEIGGQDFSEAKQTLTEAIDERVDEPIEVTAVNNSATVTARELGFTVDVDATLEPVQGFTLNPTRLWHHIAGGPTLDPIFAEGDADQAALDSLANTLTTQPEDGGVSFVDGVPYARDAVQGTTLNVGVLTEELRDNWMTMSEIEIEAEIIPPAIGQAEVNRAMAQAENLIAGPIRFTIGDTMAEVPAFEITEQARFVVVDGRLELDVDEDGLIEEIEARVPEGALEEPQNAEFEFVDRTPNIIESVDGTTIDVSGLDEAVIEALSSPDRSVPLPVIVLEPEVTTEDIEELGIIEEISTFSVLLTNDSVRTQNIATGSASINGTLVMPGETFSLTEALGPIDAANGYGNAGVISNGVLTEGMGGGLSQLTTTLYNAIHFAGLEEVEHRAHSMYISRYPEGREATIYVGVIDLKFKNNTPYGVYIESWVGGGRNHVSIWSTEYWDVTSSVSGRRNVVQPKTVTRSGDDCVPQSAGQPGFAVTVSRSAEAPDGESFEESYSWSYRAQDAVVCEAPKSDDADNGDDD